MLYFFVNSAVNDGDTVHHLIQCDEPEDEVIPGK